MQPAPELEDLMRQWYEAFAKGDTSYFERVFSRHEGLLVIGTDLQEWWLGYDTIVRTLRAQTQELSGIQMVSSAPHAYREGTVGWAADRGVFRLPNGAEVPLRTSAVFHQEDGAWKIVHWHASIGVPNQEVVGQELTV